MKNFKVLSKEEKFTITGGTLDNPIYAEHPWDVDRTDDHPWGGDNISKDIL
jgi:hypothetical protein